MPLRVVPILLKVSLKCFYFIFLLFHLNNNIIRSDVFGKENVNSPVSFKSFSSLPLNKSVSYSPISAHNLPTFKHFSPLLVTKPPRDNRSHCPPGFYGATCLNPCPKTCRRFCDINGGCIKCLRPGKIPPDCKKSCSDGYFGNNCIHRCNSSCKNSTCNSENGHCFQCKDVGFQLPSCLLPCSPGSYGKHCSFRCPKNCENNTCDSTTGECFSCTKGKGPKCIVNCAISSNNETCNNFCPKGCIDKCSTTEFKCYGCLPGYVPPFCNETCAPGRFGAFCSQTCSKRCIDFQCNHVTGDCEQCAVGYVGKQCSGRCVGGVYGKNCAHKCPETCKNKACHFQTGDCTDCFPGYTGKSCQELCSNGTYGENCAFMCLTFCEGECDPISGLCWKCKQGRIGKFCNESCPNGFFGEMCQNPCPGECLNEKCNGTTGVCHECAPGTNISVYCPVVLSSKKEKKNSNVVLHTALVLSIPVIILICIFEYIRRSIAKEEKNINAYMNQDRNRATNSELSVFGTDDKPSNNQQFNLDRYIIKQSQQDPQKAVYSQEKEYYSIQPDDLALKASKNYQEYTKQNNFLCQKGNFTNETSISVKRSDNEDSKLSQEEKGIPSGSERSNSMKKDVSMKENRSKLSDIIKHIASYAPVTEKSITNSSPYASYISKEASRSESRRFRSYIETETDQRVSTSKYPAKNTENTESFVLGKKNQGEQIGNTKAKLNYFDPADSENSTVTFSCPYNLLNASHSEDPYSADPTTGQKRTSLSDYSDPGSYEKEGETKGKYPNVSKHDSSKSKEKQNQFSIRGSPDLSYCSTSSRGNLHERSKEANSQNNPSTISNCSGSVNLPLSLVASEHDRIILSPSCPHFLVCNLSGYNDVKPSNSLYNIAMERRVEQKQKDFSASPGQFHTKPMVKMPSEPINVSKSNQIRFNLPNNSQSTLFKSSKHQFSESRLFKSKDSEDIGLSSASMTKSPPRLFHYLSSSESGLRTQPITNSAISYLPPLYPRSLSENEAHGTQQSDLSTLNDSLYRANNRFYHNENLTSIAETETTQNLPSADQQKNEKSSKSCERFHFQDAKCDQNKLPNDQEYKSRNDYESADYYNKKDYMHEKIEMPISFQKPIFSSSSDSTKSDYLSFINAMKKYTASPPKFNTNYVQMYTDNVDKTEMPPTFKTYSNHLNYKESGEDLSDSLKCNQSSPYSPSVVRCAITRQASPLVTTSSKSPANTSSFEKPLPLPTPPLQGQKALHPASKTRSLSLDNSQSSE